jgi:alpha-D-xyloside xylohydrolase
VGDRLLAAPVLSQGGMRSVYLPAGGWYDFNTGAAVEGGQTLTLHDVPLSTIPAYVRAGSIVALGPVLQYTGQGPEDPLQVRVYPGADGSFSLYEDGGDDYDYLKGQCSSIPFVWSDRGHVLTVGKRSGSYPGMLKTRHMTVTLPDGRTRTVTYTGEPVSVSF